MQWLHTYPRRVVSAGVAWVLILGLELRNMRHLVTSVYTHGAREAMNAAKLKDAPAALRMDGPPTTAHAMS